MVEWDTVNIFIDVRFILKAIYFVILLQLYSLKINGNI